jgi:hypothetical protein
VTETHQTHNNVQKQANPLSSVVKKLNYTGAKGPKKVDLKSGHDHKIVQISEMSIDSQVLSIKPH